MNMNVLSRFLRRSAGTAAAAAALLTPILLAAAQPTSVTQAPSAPAQRLVAHSAPPGVGQPLEPQPVHLVVLVDESGSLNDRAVADEENAAALIAQAELSKGSQTSVGGFGGNTGQQPNQSAIDRVCPPTTVASAPDREKLARCVSALRPRTPEEGNSTD